MRCWLVRSHSFTNIYEDNKYIACFIIIYYIYYFSKYL
jgi:hypothetical protein